MVHPISAFTVQSSRLHADSGAFVGGSRLGFASAFGRPRGVTRSLSERPGYIRMRRGVAVGVEMELDREARSAAFNGLQSPFF